MFRIKVVEKLPTRGNYYYIAEVDSSGCVLWYGSYGCSGVLKVVEFAKQMFRSDCRTILFRSQEDLENFARSYGINLFGFTSQSQLIKEVQRKLEIEFKGGAVSQSCN